MKINWKVRLKNKMFYLSLIPAVLLLITHVLAAFGVTVDLSGIGAQVPSIVGAVFSILAILGVVADPTTVGIKDSNRVMSYLVPEMDDDPEEYDCVCVKEEQ